MFCLWVLTFNPLLAEKMNKFNAIPILADILSDSVKEKVTRIVLAVFRNLIEKPEDQQVRVLLFFLVDLPSWMLAVLEPY